MKYNRARVFSLTGKKNGMFWLRSSTEETFNYYYFFGGGGEGGGGVTFEKEIQEVSKYLEQFILKGL